MIPVSGRVRLRNDTGVRVLGAYLRRGPRNSAELWARQVPKNRLGDGGIMSKSGGLTGKLHLLCGASMFAMAFAVSATTAAADSAKSSDTKKETQVAQSESAPPAPPAAEADR